MYHLEFLLDGQWKHIVSPTGGRYEYDDREEAAEVIEIIRAFAMPPGAAGIRLLDPNGQVEILINELHLT